MELDVPVDSQQLDGVAPTPTSQPPSAKDGAKDPERFYCPYPGCNRSFAELWRLKVHFRAPPDIRGSGKERGHGTELTHCPKCGKTLKPGKHHVGCSGSKNSARQTNKRSRAAGEAEPPEEALNISHPAKHVKGDLELETLTAPWPDFARSHGPHALHPLTLQPPLKQEQQEWPSALQPGIIYGPNGTATACWLPGQVNGFVPQLSAQGYVQPQFTPDMQFAGSAHGYPQQVPSFPGLQGYPQSGLAEPGQVLPVPPNGNLAQIAGMPAMPATAGLPGVSPMIFHQPTHDTSWVQSVGADQHGQQQQTAAQLAQLTPAFPQGAQAQQPNGSLCDRQQQQPGRAGELQVSGQGSDVPPVDGAAGGGTGTLPASPHRPQSQQQQPPQHPQPAKPTSSADSLGSALGDVEEFTRDFGRIPSPPPLPADFHSAAAAAGGNGGSGGMLFNFSQFGQKLPRSQSHTRLDKNLSAMGLGLDNGLEADLLYDHSDDGDLMQLLFGVPDELPTMATIHLHKWSNGDEEGEEGEPGDNNAAAPRGAAGSGPGSTPAGTQPLDESNSHGAGATPPQPPGDSAPPPAPGGVISNGKMEFLLDGPEAHPHGSGPQYLTHGGGKAALAQLVNGLSGQNHSGEDHHKDHLLDAETFRLLQSCD